jgi:ParB family chromosome partitioning protein
MNDEPRQKEHVFYIELSKIHPNPFQPRRSFDEEALKSLSDSIREYGILQPIVVTRLEKETPNGRVVEYELIAGERRFRAAESIGLAEIPAIIRREQSDKVKLELAMIENVQRENLNPIECAIAYKRLIDEFELTQKEVAKRIGKSREVVANTVRLLNLPELYQSSLVEGRITEGHARPLLMLSDYPDEQKQLFHNIIDKTLSVRAAERIARDIAVERSRKYAKSFDPETREVLLETNIVNP